jgi:hypothetical protein
MSLTSRVNKLGEAFPATDKILGVDMQAEGMQAARALGRFHYLGLSKAAKKAIRHMLCVGLANIEWLVEDSIKTTEKRSYTDHRYFSQLDEQRRNPAVLVLIFERLPADCRNRFALVLPNTRWHTDPYYWLYEWLRELRECHSRIPPDVSPEAMAKVVELQEGKPERTQLNYPPLCAKCGLLMPQIDFRYPESRAGACFHCGSAEWEYRTRVADLAWTAQAKEELANMIDDRHDNDPEYPDEEDS